MAFKKKTKVTAEFSMASLTDIIFLLLIFFMLTSGLVSPNALNLELPGSGQKKTSGRATHQVAITENGQFVLNGKQLSLQALDQQLSQRKVERTILSIAPDSGTPTEYVVAVMDIALRYNLQSVLAINRD